MNNEDGPKIDLMAHQSRGIKHQGLRRANERAVLTVVGFNGGVSNADIARISGLAPQTVSAILVNLEEAGLVERGEVLRGRRGQPATPISLRASGGYAIGIELGWRHADVVSIDLHGIVHERRHLDYGEADLAALAPRLAGMIAELTDGWSEDQLSRLNDIGIGMPGSIHAAGWSLTSSPGSKIGPTQAGLAAELKKLTGLSVTVFNDGNAACWAEMIHHPAPRPRSFIYLLVSTYVAGGLIGDGQLWHGPNGHSADLGAMLVGGDTGQKSAHATASVTALVERIIRAGGKADLARLEYWDWAALEDIVEPWLEDSARALALVVFNTNALVEGNHVILDTIMPPYITARLVEKLIHHFAQLPGRHDLDIVAGTVGRLAPAIGAAELTLYRRYFSRTMLDRI